MGLGEAAVSCASTVVVAAVVNSEELLPAVEAPLLNNLCNIRAWSTNAAKLAAVTGMGFMGNCVESVGTVENVLLS